MLDSCLISVDVCERLDRSIRSVWLSTRVCVWSIGRDEFSCFDYFTFSSVFWHFIFKKSRISESVEKSMT